jgi:hypothetical protein
MDIYLIEAEAHSRDGSHPSFSNKYHSDEPGM